MAADLNFISRYEAKYLISEATARAIREFVSGFCSPDEYVGPEGRYFVSSIYFDTPDLRFYHDTKFRRYNRFKARVRFYGKEPGRFLWAELKHKRKNVTWKVRRRVGIVEWPDLSAGRVPAAGPSHWVDLTSSFEDIVWRFQARPIIYVQYVREPWVSDLDVYGRVTFDRRLSYRPVSPAPELPSAGDLIYYDDPVTTGCPWDDSPVILEIKTEMQVPTWVIRLIQNFDLSQRGFSKYCNAIDKSLIASGRGDREGIGAARSESRKEHT